MDQDNPWMNDDRHDDEDCQDEQPPFEVVQEELDDEYGREYFRKFETNPLYDRNEYDASYKSIRVVRKYCQERGLPYLRHNGHQQPARSVKDACTCRKLCYAKFSDDLRAKLLNNLLELSADGQNTFLICHIESIPAHCPKQAQQQKSVRNYYLPSDSGRVRVCKVMFANTFDLSAKKLRGIHRKATSGAYDEWLKQLLPVQEGLDIGPEEQDSSSDVENIHESSAEDPILNDQSEENQSNDGSDDDSDIELAPLNTENDDKLNTENATEEPKPLLDDSFLDRYFRQLYEADPPNEELESDKIKPRGSVLDILSEPCKCVVYHCTRWFTDDLRQKIRSRYAMLPPSKQDRFLQDHTKQIMKKRHKNHLSRRNFTYLYLIPTASGMKNVCKVMFLNTFKVNDHLIRDLNSKKESTETTEEANQDAAQNVQSNKKRVSSIFAFDPTLIDPLALPEGSTSFTRRKRRSSKLSEDTETSIVKGKIPKTNADTKSKKSTQAGGTKSQEVKDGDDDLSESNISRQTKSFQYPPEAEIDDAFLDEYFLSYETNDDHPANTKSWLNLEDSPAVPSACTCQKRCFNAFPNDSRVKIFTRFAKLTPINQQRFLYRHVRIKRHVGSATRKKKYCTYFLPSKTGLVKVCSVMFIRLYGVTEKKMRSLVKRRYLGVGSGNNVRTKQVKDKPEECSTSGVPPREVVPDDVEDIIQIETPLLQPSNDTNINQNEEFSLDIPMDTVIDDEELDIKYSYELLNIEPQDDYNDNNALGSNYNHSASATGMDCSIKKSIKIIPEIDEDFLDEYFIQFEINDVRERVNGRKIKPMTRKNAIDDQIVMEPCTCVKYKCFTWLTDDLRQKLYSRFVRLAPLSQKLFIKRHIRREHKKRSFKITSRRNYSMFYFMPTKKGQFKVCKVMFMNTFKVTDKKLRTLLDSNQFDENLTEETTFGDVEINTGIDNSYLHAPASNEESQHIDQFNTDIKEEPELSCTNEYEEETPPAEDALLDDHQAAELPATNYYTTDEETLSETETRNKSATVDFDDAFIDEYFSPYECAININQASVKARKRWINADASPSGLQPCPCYKQCSKVFPDELRTKIFTRFSKLPPLNQQRFLRSHIKIDGPERRRKPSTSVRNVWLHYLPANPVPVKVCRKMFTNTFQVTEKKIRLLMKRGYLDENLPEHETETDDQLELNEETMDDDYHFMAAISDHQIEDAEGIGVMAELTELPKITKENTNATVQKHDEQDNPTVSAVELDEAFLNGYFQGLLNSAVDKRPTKHLSWHQVNTSEVPNTLGPACSCDRQCYLKFPDHLRHMILNKYIQFSLEDRMYFVKSHITIEDPRCSKESMEKTGSKIISCYHFPSNVGRIRVCRVMFRNTFNLDNEQLRSILIMKCFDLRKRSFDIDDLSTDTDYSDNPSVEIKIEKNSEDLNETANLDNSKRQHAFDIPNESIGAGNDLPTDTKCPDESSVETKLVDNDNKKPKRRSRTAVRNTLQLTCSCPRQCNNKFPNDLRRALFEKYAELSFRERMQYLRNHIKIVSPNVRRKPMSSRRKFTYIYYMQRLDDLVKVCKNMFIHTFGLTDRKLRSCLAKQWSGENTPNEEAYEVSDAAMHDDSSVEIKYEIDSDDLDEMIVGD